MRCGDRGAGRLRPRVRHRAGRFANPRSYLPVPFSPCTIPPGSGDTCQLVQGTCKPWVQRDLKVYVTLRTPRQANSDLSLSRSRSLSLFLALEQRERRRNGLRKSRSAPFNSQSSNWDFYYKQRVQSPRRRQRCQRCAEHRSRLRNATSFLDRSSGLLWSHLHLKLFRFSSYHRLGKHQGMGGGGGGRFSDLKMRTW